MKILLTGAYGFLGREIQQVLSEYEIVTHGRNHGVIKCDLSVDEPVLPVVDIVIHTAGKAHSIARTTLEKQDFFTVNVNGTRNLLNGLASNLPKAFVFISSVSVYGRDSGIDISEDEPLLATDPYGRSKIEAESMIELWCKKNNVICTILRLPLIAGSSPLGNLKSMIDGIRKGYYFNVAGGIAKKSVVLGKDVAAIIPTAAAIGGIYNLTDRVHPSFASLAALISKQLDKSAPLNIPLWLAVIIGKIGDLLGKRSPINSNKLKKMISDLTFDDSKAFKILGWRPTSVLNGFKIF
jgi:nucleoside-diphosphate-sugar epimerase